MVLNTITVGAAVTPTVVETYFAHYLNRKPLRQHPTAHISYHEGLQLIRHFLTYASHHTVEELQAFTSQWVPNPRWVKVDDVAIPQEHIEKSADILVSQLGHKARYRLAPQFPFPCGLHDCLAAYIFLLTEQDPSTVILAGDSAGGGMVTSMLLIIRDQGLPLPAGAILISPWVDLTHSFPSLSGDSRQDYIPAHGFLHKPSAAWPPPNADDMHEIALHAVEKVVEEGLPRKSSQADRRKLTQAAVQGFSEDHDPQYLHPIKGRKETVDTKGAGARSGNDILGTGHDLSIVLDDKLVYIRDQIQMYATNQLISHPLVSPVLAPSLGGLPPLLILAGGGELLRDEQIYLAHKAANPSKYPPSEAFLDEHPEARDLIHKYKPTDVQLQVWTDLCHVAPTLSFTRPAKYMYRSIAQFGAWALARAQKTEIDIMDDDDLSVISSGSNTDSNPSDLEKPVQTQPKMKNGITHKDTAATESVGKAGQSLPHFQDHMIRQRVDRHGDIFPLEPASSMPALQMSPSEIGVIKPGPVRKWLAAKKEWDTKFAKEKRRVQKQRIKEMAQGYQGFGEDDDAPPPSALAGRRGINMPREEKKGRSWGMSLWSLWGSKHDESTMQREEKADKNPEITTVTPAKATHDSAADQQLNSPMSARSKQQHTRSRSRRRTVTDTGQSDGVDEETPAAELLHRRENQAHQPANPGDQLVQPLSSAKPNSSTTDYLNLPSPAAGGGIKNTPLRLKALGDEGVNASTVALKNYQGLRTPREDVDKQLGDEEGMLVGGGKTVVGGKEDGSGERPGMERFETAREEL